MTNIHKLNDEFDTFLSTGKSPSFQITDFSSDSVKKHAYFLNVLHLILSDYSKITDINNTLSSFFSSSRSLDQAYGATLLKLFHLIQTPTFDAYPTNNELLHEITSNYLPENLEKLINNIWAITEKIKENPSHDYKCHFIIYYDQRVYFNLPWLHPSYKEIAAPIFTNSSNAAYLANSMMQAINPSTNPLVKIKARERKNKLLKFLCQYYNTTKQTEVSYEIIKATLYTTSGRYDFQNDLRRLSLEKDGEKIFITENFLIQHNTKNQSTLRM